MYKLAKIKDGNYDNFESLTTYQTVEEFYEVVSNKNAFDKKHFIEYITSGLEVMGGFLILEDEYVLFNPRYNGEVDSVYGSGKKVLEKLIKGLRNYEIGKIVEND